MNELLLLAAEAAVEAVAADAAAPARALDTQWPLEFCIVQQLFVLFPLWILATDSRTDVWSRHFII